MNLKLLAKVADSEKDSDESFTYFHGRSISGNQQLVDAWKIVKDDPEAVRRNTSVLENISSLSAKTLNGNPLNVQKLFDNGFGICSPDKCSDL